MPTNIYDVTQPADTQLANLLGLDLRNLALNVQQRMALISGLAANIWNPALDAQPGNWTGLLYFATDTGRISQWNGAGWVDVTASILSSGPQIVASPPALLAQQANVPSTILYTVPAGKTGRYRFSAYLVVTRPASNSCTIPAVNVFWTDADTGVAQNYIYTQPGIQINLAGAVPSLNVNSGSLLPGFIMAPAGSNISFSTTGYVSSGATPMQFSVRATLEYLGA